VKVLRRTLYLDRTLAVTHFTLGILLRRLQDSKGASRSFENTLKLCRMVLPETVPSLSDGETTGQLLQAAQTQLAQMRDLELNGSQETGGEACL
jgi:chemotaxis protein methyltransferase CheR